MNPDMTNEYWENAADRIELELEREEELGDQEYVDNEDYDDSMDGDHDSAMSSVGWGTDEDYGFYDDELSNEDCYYE